jgi:CheY-like chemotaxis protein
MSSHTESGDNEQQAVVFASKLSNVRHDLRTSVGHITGYSEMLLEDYEEDLPAFALEYLVSINTGGERLLAVIDELLGQAKLSLSALDLPDVRRRLLVEASAIATSVETLLASPKIVDHELRPDFENISSARLELVERVETQLVRAQFVDPLASDGAALQPEASGDASLLEEASMASRFDAHGEILVVDDDSANRSLLNRRLSNQGYTVQLAEGGEAALEFMADNPVDLVLLDLLMPGIDGLETLQRLKLDPVLKHVPVLMLSAVDDVGKMAQCIAAGAEDYIAKPFNPVLLRSRIGTVLEKYRLRRQFARNVRVFISSPGDVIPERRVVKHVIGILNEEFAGRAFMIPILWEEEPLVASDTFQAQIEQPSESDIYIGILWSRIGSELPASILRNDGSRYESGTIFEFEEAIRGHADHGHPEILVYRKTLVPTVILENREVVMEQLDQAEKLNGYIESHFKNQDGSYKRAFHNFETLDQFESMVSMHLGKLLANMVESWT